MALWPKDDIPNCQTFFCSDDPGDRTLCLMKKLLIAAAAALVVAGATIGTFLLAMMPLLVCSAVVWAVYNLALAPVFHWPGFNYLVCLGVTYLVFVLRHLASK